MRFASLFVGLTTAAIASSLSVPRSSPEDSFTGGDHYGAPHPPWDHDAQPGWYYGNEPDKHSDLFCLTPETCRNLESHGYHCPHEHHPSGYKRTFHDLSGATEASDYLTFGLVDTIDDCLAMCNSVPGCNFVNTYHDVNGKNGSPLLTCSLFEYCHDSSDAINRGGQTQPDGSIDYIADSDGWCKK